MVSNGACAVQVPANASRTRSRPCCRPAQYRKLKGFRPGKVPIHVIRQRFGPQIRQEVLHDVVQSSYSEAIAREKLRPAGTPRSRRIPRSQGKDFAYTASVRGLSGLSRFTAWIA